MQYKTGFTVGLCLADDSLIQKNKS